MNKPIENREDIRLLVESFYAKVKQDEIIGDIFNNTLFFSWDTHIPIMIDFWETILLGATSYQGNTMKAHTDLDKKYPLQPAHFERWKKLFFETLDEYFTGDNVTEAKRRVELMAMLISGKIEHSRKPGFIQ